MSRPYRIIHSLHFIVCVGGAKSTMTVALDRRGNASTNRADGDGNPRSPKLRSIDLRPGDQIKWHKHWRTIERVAVCRDAWLTEAEALACQDEGYIYRPVTHASR